MSAKAVSAIALEDVGKTYFMEGIPFTAIRDLSLSIGRGSFVSILGPSGCGKSTLLHLMGLLDKPTSGKVFIDGTDTSLLKGNEIARIRGLKIGFIFQSFNLHPSLTAMENVELPGIIVEKERPQKARELLEMVGLGRRTHHLPSQLSGGERQRVAIARALVNDPAILLADEPTGNLDSVSGENIIRMLSDLNAKTGVTIVMVTHNEAIAERCERIIQMKDGKVVRDTERK